MTIPLRIEVRPYRPDGSRLLLHDMTFGPPGASPLAHVLIWSEVFTRASMSERYCDGHLRLRPDVFEALAVHCFNSAVNHMIEQDGSSVVWTQADATTWLRSARFRGNDLEFVLRQLQLQVQPDQSYPDNVIVSQDQGTSK